MLLLFELLNCSCLNPEVLHFFQILHPTKGENKQMCGTYLLVKCEGKVFKEDIPCHPDKRTTTERKVTDGASCARDDLL